MAAPEVNCFLRCFKNDDNILAKRYKKKPYFIFVNGTSHCFPKLRIKSLMISISVMEILTAIVNGLWRLTIVVKRFILVVPGSLYLPLTFMSSMHHFITFITYTRGREIQEPYYI